ncbi:hypothetical protein L2D14_18310 [Thalassospiraceae bacterium LMO-JJ14]|nr:hypothetical protein L2D14_18310 [Thalassospiraceae bacterium LMO-JJ14]
MKSRILACAAAALIMVASAPAFASSCPKHMKAIDEALKSASLSKAQMGKVTGLRAKGEAMHKAGKHAESMKALSEAEKILGIQ